jgi:hypothetical protein
VPLPPFAFTPAAQPTASLSPAAGMRDVRTPAARAKTHQAVPLPGVVEQFILALDNDLVREGPLGERALTHTLR